MQQEVVMLGRILNRVQSMVEGGLQRVVQVVSRWTKPGAASLALSTVADLARSKPQLIAENLLLRQSGRREDITIPLWRLV